MANNYSDMIAQLNLRQNPDSVTLEKGLRDELITLSGNQVLYYVRLAMNAVDPAYTQKSKDAGTNVKTHLINGGLTNVDFQYQGSVMTDTHIKGHSDIDLLAISSKSYQIAQLHISGILNDYSRRSSYSSTSIAKMEAEQNVPSYHGNALDDLRKLRTDSESILARQYNSCETHKPKSIKIYNSNLHREVDIVIARSYDDIRSIINNKGEYRGIQIYNKHEHTVGDADFPFLSIKRINERSAETSGRLKKMIRFLKNVKAKSGLDIKLNSFEFNAICYNIAKDKYATLAYYELVAVIYHQIKMLCENQTAADSLLSVDDSEYIFQGKPEKLQNLRYLRAEVESIFNDLRLHI